MLLWVSARIGISVITRRGSMSADARIRFYQTRDAQQLQLIHTETAQLQSGLWSSVRTAAAAQPTQVMALAFTLIADIDSPRGGVIRVKPQNLIALELPLKPL